MDEKQRPTALSAKIKGVAWSPLTFIPVCLFLLLGISVYLAFQNILLFYPLSIYAAVSLLTIRAYSRDKSAAQMGLKRTPEKRLHLLEAVGGWPGALFAQLFYRHKNKKISYQIVFWLIVAGHGFLWYGMLTHQEIVAEKIQALTQIVKGEKPEVLSLTNVPKTSTKQGTGFHSQKRSIIAPPGQALIAEGIVKEIRPEGLAVSLQTGTEGMIARSTLVSSFSTRFTKGEHIRVAIRTITFDGKKNRIEFVLVE